MPIISVPIISDIINEESEDFVYSYLQFEL